MFTNFSILWNIIIYVCARVCDLKVKIALLAIFTIQLNG
jgi:hypothetical protein